MQYDIKKKPRLVEPGDEVLRHGQVAGAGDGQELGQSLNEPQYHGGVDAHPVNLNSPSPPEGSSAGGGFGRGRTPFHGGNDQTPELLQQLLVLQEAAGNDLGRGLHATVLLVDGDDRNHDAAFREMLAIAKHAVSNVPEPASIDEDPSRLLLAGDAPSLG